MTGSRGASVPSHWESLRLKFAVALVTRKAEGESARRPYVGLENVASGTGRLLNAEDVSEVEGISNLFDHKHILFGKLWPYLAKAFRPHFEGRCSSEFFVLYPKTVDQNFLFWYCLSDWFLKTVDSSTYGAKMPRASWDFVGSLPISYPSCRDRQRSIADFLDRKTAAIDATIRKKERLIELLQEKRLALITQAVTKGLDPTVTMKEPGEPFIGPIPSHWACQKLSTLAGKLCNGFVGPTRDILAHIFILRGERISP